MALRAEKLANERVAKGNFRRGKALGSCLDNLIKKSRSSESSGNSSRSGIKSVSFPEAFRPPQPSRLGTSPPVLFLEDELHLKDARVVVNLTLGLVALIKYADRKSVV